jgi:hypothetical protein
MVTGLTRLLGREASRYEERIGMRVGSVNGIRFVVERKFERHQSDALRLNVNVSGYEDRLTCLDRLISKDYRLKGRITNLRTIKSWKITLDGERVRIPAQTQSFNVACAFHREHLSYSPHSLSTLPNRNQHTSVLDETQSKCLAPSIASCPVSTATLNPALAMTLAAPRAFKSFETRIRSWRWSRGSTL